MSDTFENSIKSVYPLDRKQIFIYSFLIYALPKIGTVNTLYNMKINVTLQFFVLWISFDCMGVILPKIIFV